LGGKSGVKRRENRTILVLFFGPFGRRRQMGRPERSGCGKQKSPGSAPGPFHSLSA
jgi:hypothetical protein